MLQLRSSSRAALVAAVLLTPFAAQAAQTVPFVGCASDGQQGPVAAPKGQPKAVNIDPAAANGLAWYQAQYSAGALAPRRGRRDAGRLLLRPPTPGTSSI